MRDPRLGLFPAVGLGFCAPCCTVSAADLSAMAFVLPAASGEFQKEASELKALYPPLHMLTLFYRASQARGLARLGSPVATAHISGLN